MMIRCALLFALAFAVLASSAWAKPERIVSINLCADQFLLAMADPASIASVSYFAPDPDVSSLAARARGIPVNYARAEEVLLFRPDLVLTGAFTTRTTADLLRRLNVPVHVVDVPTDLDGVRRVTVAVAEAIGEPEKGAALVADMDRRLAAIPPASASRPTAAVFRANGISRGRGTLFDDLLQKAGWRNLAADLGLVGFAYLPLETLLLAEPDLLIFGSLERAAPSLGEMLVRHPALAGARAPWRRLVVPARLMQCGTPDVVAVVEMLARARP